MLASNSPGKILLLGLVVYITTEGFRSDLFTESLLWEYKSQEDPPWPKEPTSFLSKYFRLSLKQFVIISSR